MVAGLEVGEDARAGLEQLGRVHVLHHARRRKPPRVSWSPPYSRSMGTALLEVTVLGPRDVAGADEGGADRLHLAGEGGLSPEPDLVSATCRETELPVFVVLRLNDSLDHHRRRADPPGRAGRGLPRLWRDGRRPRVPRRRPRGRHRPCAEHLVAALPEVPWTFPRAVDDTLDPRRSWRRLLALPGLVAVHSAGSPRGLSVGYDDLLATAESDPRDRLAAHARPADCSPSTCRGSCRPGCGSSTSGPRRGRGRRTAPTSTPGTCARGGCCSTAPSGARRDRSPADRWG